MFLFQLLIDYFKANMEKAEAKYKEALAIDSGAAQIWNGLYSVYFNQVGSGWRPVARVDDASPVDTIAAGHCQ